MKNVRAIGHDSEDCPHFAKTGGTYSVKVDLKSALDSQMSPDLSSLTADGVIQSNDIQLQNIEVFSQLATLLKMIN